MILKLNKYKKGAQNCYCSWNFAWALCIFGMQRLDNFHVLGNGLFLLL